MIFRCTKLLAVTVFSFYLVACSSSSSSSDTAVSSGTLVSMGATPSPANASVMAAGEKIFSTMENHQVTIKKAYLVISSTTIETSCGVSFTATLDGLLNFIIPQAHAHTTATPTSTGEPHVINLLAIDDLPVSIGSMSPAAADYCGVDVDIFAADDDTISLPADIDMVGRTVYIEADYILQDGVTTGSILLDTGATLINRKMLLSSLMMISSSSPTGTVNLGINYDTWFDAVDLELLKSEVLAPTDPNSEGFKVLQNITNSIHQI